MQEVQLSPHFKLSEFCDTWRGGYLEEVNWEYGTSEPYLSNMGFLCRSLLEPLRRHFMSPVIISAGMRWSRKDEEGSWEGLDYEIRNVRQKKVYDGRSQHRKGEAADLGVVGVPDSIAFEWIKDHSPNPYGQLILETDGRNRWVHLSIPGRRIPELGGTLLYGQAKNAYQDSLGRWYYQTVKSVDSSADDSWGMQSEWNERTSG
jgi:zinc D-Ala-D-Ala carboxypeptidase